MNYDPLEQPIVRDTWIDKYRYNNEPDWGATCERVVGALTKNEVAQVQDEALAAMKARLIVPAGRVLAGAGTKNRVTLINCFVGPRIQDSMRTHVDHDGCGIMDALCVSAYSQQMGGGIGNNFSTIRPRGAVVRHTQSVSSGIVPFMQMWDAMCATIRSSGGKRPRRGAMMGTVRCDHPDIIELIEAKQAWAPHTPEFRALPPDKRQKILTNFNVSVMVTDEFMRAVEEDSYWELRFGVPPADAYGRMPASCRGVLYTYYKLRARELWDLITESTYVHAEPGVIFIDRVNALNNLSYCEFIESTNPCGEQPLPPNGCCDLGHVNLAVMVRNAFAEDAYFDFSLLARAGALMVRLLDNVLDETLWPTFEQAEEARNKRRIGLGFTGLATALQQLGIAYGSPVAVNFTRSVTRALARAAYMESCKLAEERGPFPLYDEEAFCSAPFIRKLDREFKAVEGIKKHGIRNGVLMSIAPTGTTSLVLGNVSSGIEPVFAHRYRRMVRGAAGQVDDEYSVFDYGYLKYCEKHRLDPEKDPELPPGFTTTADLDVEAHLQMAAAAQEWVDAAVSKTINCPESMSIGDFRAVYSRAYELGLKGCTTYRPDPRSARGAVLVEEPKKEDSCGKESSSGEEADREEGGGRPREGGGPGEEVGREDPQARVVVADTVSKVTEVREPLDKIPMQDVVEGRRYRVRWPTEDCAYYIIITDYIDAQNRRRPFELFISTKSERHSEWVRAFSLLVTAVFRREGDPTFVVDELRSVFSAAGGSWVRVPWEEKSKFVPSLVAAVGLKIEEHLRWLGMMGEGEVLRGSPLAAQPIEDEPVLASEFLAVCEQCGARAVIYSEGCSTCRACGRSDCG